MALAVFNPLAFGAPSLSVRCSASGDQSSATSNGSTTAPASVKMTPALTSSGLPPVSRTAEASSMSVLHPGLEFANLMFFRGSYNAQVFVGEDEPADSVVRRFRKAVMQAGVIPECRRRRFHETPQDIVKRKQQNARRRKSSGRRFTGPRPDGFGDKKEGATASASNDDDDDDFWGYAEEGSDVTV